MKKIKILGILILSFSILMVVEVGAVTRTALIIGNGKYKSAPLKNPVNDAKDLANVLKKLGFEVNLKTNTDKRTMLKAISEFGKKLRDAQVGLFFYAGHGMQVNGINYLIPIGAYVTEKTDVEIEGVDARRILGRMETAGNDVNIIFLDACRNNPFHRSFRSANNGLAKMDAPKGTFIAYATSPGSLAADGAGRNSPFTENLLKNISEPNLLIENLLKKVRNGVLRETEDKQMPWQASSLTGNFYFNPQKEAPVLQTVRPKEVPEQVYQESGGLSSNVFVSTEPENTRIRILNITPKFYQGIELNPGRYLIEVSQIGYKTVKRWETLAVGENLTLEVRLEQLQDGVVSSGSSGRLSTRELRYAQSLFERKKKPEAESIVTKILNSNSSDDTSLAEAMYCQVLWQLCSNEREVLEKLKAYYPNFQNIARLEAIVKAREETQRKIESEKKEKLKRKFVWVPKGCFQMGSSSGSTDERPVHEACVDGFWIGKHEVTQGEWRSVMGSNPSEFRSGDNYPVETVSWNDSKEFIEKLSQRSGEKFSLPTEAQWEYAARSGGKNESYVGGNDIDRVAWYDGNSGKKTHPVGTKAPNGLGIYDMSGNVWEWCEDVYNENAYSKHSRNNPVSTSGSSNRVLRGGSWRGVPSYCRAANRFGRNTSLRTSDRGFRLVLLSGQ